MGTLPNKLAVVGKLAIAGEKAGFTIEEMIDLLNSGVTVQTLLGLIEMRLIGDAKPPTAASPHRWLM